MAKTKQRLGKGLNALIPDKVNADSAEPIANASLTEIDPKLIKTNPYQPRLSFDEKALNELKQSIKENGLIQPIAVRKTKNFYELVAGERRLRSVLDLGYEKIPAYILDISSKEEMLEIALIENVQREKLNIVELAQSYKRLIDECNLTIENVAKKIGKDRSTINNIIRLLKLPNKVHEALKKNEISAGHARSLLALDSKSDQVEVMKTIISKDLSVRKTEQFVKELNNVPTTATKTESSAPIHKKFHAKVESSLRNNLGTKVKVKPKRVGGTIEIDYYSDEDLLRINELIENLND